MQDFNLDNESLVKFDPLANVQPHECLSANGLSERCRFCLTCGIYIPSSLGVQKNPSSSHFYRSRRFNMRDPTCSNSNNILEQMISKQSVNRYYNVSAHNLQKRSPLIEWMQSLCQNLQYSLTTFYLAVAYVDAIFSLYIIKESQIKLIGYIAIYMSAKMEEEDSKIPTIKQAVKMFKDEFSEEEIVNCEKFMFRILGYNMNLKTPFSFLMFFFSKGFISGGDLQGLTSQEQIYSYVENIEKLALFFMDLSVKHYDFYQFTSIAIASTAIACARKCVGVKSWSVDLEKLTFVSWEAIKDCRQMLFKLFESSYPEMYQNFFPEPLVPEQKFGSPMQNSENRDPNQPYRTPVSDRHATGVKNERGTFTKSFENTTPSRRKNSETFSTNEPIRGLFGLEVENKDERQSSFADKVKEITEFDLENDEDSEPNKRVGTAGGRLFGVDLKNIAVKRDERN
jgi:hypothetical protein